MEYDSCMLGAAVARAKRKRAHKKAVWIWGEFFVK
jgi:hypothetical protein